MDWRKTTDWEKSWWGNCVNTYGEEEKQLTYAQKMGLSFFHNGKSPYNIDMQDKSVLDIGGGAVSLLLKCVNLTHSMVIDPCDYPEWVRERYAEAHIEYHKRKAEDIDKMLSLGVYDEVWIYNVLQHTEVPGKIIRNAKKHAKIIRIFEWIDTHTNEGHPWTLTEKQLNEWLGGEGKVDVLDKHTLRGKCYYGVFKGNHYED